MKHLAIFDEKTTKKVLLGEKTLDLRLSQNRIAPFGRVSSGDLVLVKKSGGDVIGEFKVRRVITYDNLSKEQIAKIKKDYNRFLKMDSLYWHEKEDAKFGTLIFMEKFQPTLLPLKIKKRDQRGWVVL